MVAAGGDGTINEVVNGLAGSETALGVLPVGTMNVFAAELGVPNRLRDAWRVIKARHLRTIDLARANRQYFVQLAGVGLDAQVVKETSWTSKRNFGPLSYLFSTAQIASRKPPRIIAEADGRTVEGSFILIGNGRFYGGPIAFFKKARVDDGLLDVLIFKKMGHLDLARYFAHIVMGRHTSLSDVEYFQAGKVQMHSADDVPVEVDGELTTDIAGDVSNFLKEIESRRATGLGVRRETGGARISRMRALAMGLRCDFCLGKNAPCLS